MTLAGFIAYSGALALAAAIPGPGVTALVARALGSGFRSALFMSLGLIARRPHLSHRRRARPRHRRADLRHGLPRHQMGRASPISPISPGPSGRAASPPRTSRPARARAASLPSFLAGLTVTLGNPKTMIFYLAITPTIVDLKTITLADYGMLALLTIIVLLVVLVPYLALAAKARWFLKTPRALKALNRTAATFMAGAAAAIAARQ